MYIAYVYILEYVRKQGDASRMLEYLTVLQWSAELVLSRYPAVQTLGCGICRISWAVLS